MAYFLVSSVSGLLASLSAGFLVFGLCEQARAADRHLPPPGSPWEHERPAGSDSEVTPSEPAATKRESATVQDSTVPLRRPRPQRKTGIVLIRGRASGGHGHLSESWGLFSDDSFDEEGAIGVFGARATVGGLLGSGGWTLGIRGEGNAVVNRYRTRSLWGAAFIIGGAFRKASGNFDFLHFNQGVAYLPTWRQPLYEFGIEYGIVKRGFTVGISTDVYLSLPTSAIVGGLTLGWGSLF